MYVIVLGLQIKTLVPLVPTRDTLRMLTASARLMRVAAGVQSIWCMLLLTPRRALEHSLKLVVMHVGY